LLQHPPELARLVNEIRGLQKEFPKTAEVVHFEPPQQDLKNIHLEGRPWLQIYTLDLPENELVSLFTRLQTLLAKYQPFEFIKKLEFERVLGGTASYIKGNFDPAKSDAAILGANPDSYLFFLQELLRPFLKSWAGLIRPYIEHDRWLLNICPACGHTPVGGRQERNGGRRFLVCSLCETEWLFNRVTCPACYNNDHPALGYFTVEGAGGWRVSFCNKCSSYIKEIISDNPVSALDFELAIQLDLLAEREGFRR